MIAPFVATLVLASTAAAQITQFVGTWSSGSMQVVTGPGFANPANTSFTYPNVSGISYSFSTDSYYEIARYRFVSNGTEPNCIQAVINWSHGTVTFPPNGSIVMTPLGDGYQEVQDPCAATSAFMQNYNDTELYQTYAFVAGDSGTQLQLYQFDGSPLAPMSLVSSTPEMLPTQSLRNVSTTTTQTVTTTNGLTTANDLAVNGARSWNTVGFGGVVASIALGASSLLL